MALTSPRFADSRRMQEAAVKGNKPLKSPENSEAVGRLQQALVDLKYPMPKSFRKTGKPDGRFGDETTSTVRQFQKDKNLTMVDGKAGNETLHKLDELFQPRTDTPPETPPAPPPTPAPPLTVRKNIFNLTQVEQMVFAWVMWQLIYRPNAFRATPYATFVNHHRNMGHFMHSRYVDGSNPAGMFHPQGVCRFLPWHRVYVRKLELEMKKVDPRAFVPYWHWRDANARGYPAWMDQFIGWSYTLPATGGMGALNVTIRRTPNGAGKAALLLAAGNVPAILEQPTYLDFTQQLETGPHNAIHNWCGLGSTMANVISPADPIFWTHHAEVDRLWSMWQLRHPDQDPPFHAPPPGTRYREWNTVPAETFMTPFAAPNGPEYYRDIKVAGYNYDDLSTP